eukprot:797621-Pyramimonas_sp.AAC.1
MASSVWPLSRRWSSDSPLSLEPSTGSPLNAASVVSKSGSGTNGATGAGNGAANSSLPSLPGFAIWHAGSSSNVAGSIPNWDP